MVCEGLTKMVRILSNLDRFQGLDSLVDCQIVG